MSNFPLEITVHTLEKGAKFITHFLSNWGQNWQFFSFNLLDFLIQPVIKQLISLSEQLAHVFWQQSQPNISLLL